MSHLLKFGDRSVDGLDVPGKAATIIGTMGWAATQDVLWLIGVAFGFITLTVQVVWEYYRQRRRTYIESEIRKAEARKRLSSQGIEIPKSLQESPDPDSE
jgi:hypothetical protein